jgi:hypothetical protein
MGDNQNPLVLFAFSTALREIAFMFLGLGKRDA